MEMLKKNFSWVVLAFLALIFTLSIECVEQPNLKQVSEWRSIDFVFPTDQQRQNAISQRTFIPGNAVPIDVDVHYKVKPTDSRVFITFPRFRDGIPITLGVRSLKKSSDGSQMIEPYPNYSWHENVRENCENKILSAFRIAIDSCERLWVVDTGKLGLADANQTCPPKILIFNLNTNQLVHRYTIPSNQYVATSLFINPIVDEQTASSGACTVPPKVYIADVAGFGLLVYDGATDSSWRVNNKLFEPTASFARQTISGESFDLSDGIFGIALNKLGTSMDRNERSLYFHALASDSENSVPLSVLNDRTAWLNNPNSHPNAFKVVGTKGSQSAASSMDTNGNLFLSLNNINAIACWDISKQTFTQNTLKILIRDDEKLQFPSGMKVIRNTDGEEELWVVTNRFQKIMTGTMNNSEVNFRIQAQRIQKLLNGIRCT